MRSGCLSGKGMLLGAALGLALGGCGSSNGGGAPTGSGGSGTGGGTNPPGSGGRSASDGTTASGGTTGGQAGGGAGGNLTGGATGTAGAGGRLTGSCVPTKTWGTADPTTMGTFQITTEKNVGPLAGVLPDFVYKDKQQKFNVYRPMDLADGYCHPILVWSNGHGDNPEPSPPDCITGNGQYCGSYLMVMKQMASHGFVVIASLSTLTSEPDPTHENKLPGIIGLDWLLQQAEDPASPYYHHLDTEHIGAFGHSMGGMATCLLASDPRISAITTVSGTRSNPGIHQPALLFCGGMDITVECDTGVLPVYTSITTQPAMFVDNLASNHGGWLYQGDAKGPDIFGMTAWFRVHLMGDTANRKYFYGASCTLCTDNRVTVTRNMFLTQ